MRYCPHPVVEALRKTMAQVQGTFGLAVIHRQMPDEIVVAGRGSPLVIRISEDGHFAASDVSALLRYTNKVVRLQDNELASLFKHDFRISAVHAKQIRRPAALRIPQVALENTFLKS
jgi:glucosamine--fructose-6-phosphate aminotransferase (isomerizing)